MNSWPYQFAQNKKCKKTYNWKFLWCKKILLYCVKIISCLWINCEKFNSKSICFVPGLVIRNKSIPVTCHENVTSKELSVLMLATMSAWETLGPHNNSISQVYSWTQLYKCFMFLVALQSLQFLATVPSSCCTTRHQEDFCSSTAPGMLFQ